MGNIIFYDHLEYFTAIWYNLWPFGVVCVHLVYFSRFDMFGPRKIWQPWLVSLARLKLFLEVNQPGLFKLCLELMFSTPHTCSYSIGCYQGIGENLFPFSTFVRFLTLSDLF
jgi:hypothetical protein